MPGPCFYVTVVGEGDLIDFTRVVTEAVWGRFTRGLMKFDGRREDDGRVRITVTEVRN